ncbi:helicase A859L [Corynebacterium vitaeruminis DSM 20294]|uniref:Helicase A859L n=1 Tax=Corynebacterium vitaeruminis DSM 20294 TaxID=1224164 RepID=W5XY07_9CORY|nr:helicase A859L [Corynebacterium vitaeruminis DSM 20294]
MREQGRLDELTELESKLAEVNKGIEDVDYRAANVRTGYVYVISNIGSFGERMVKIGMTRRLDPYDRVSELSDASVPFNFDVHAMHFSEDAVGIEAELHRIFADRKVNRINSRREFFYVTPAEVKQELLKVAGNILEYVDEPEAEQYRESLKIQQAESAQP